MANWSVNTDTQVAHSPPSYHSHVGTLIGLAMRSTKIGLALLVAFVLGCQTAAFAGDDGRSRDGKRWWRGEWKEQFWDGPCEVKIESKRGEFKREIKCKDGVGAQWRGEWKKEFRDGPCLVKQEAKRDEFKEEVKCERRK